MTALFFNHVWQSTLCAGVMAILAFALRHNHARLRYGLWLAASVKFLVPFAMLAAAGRLLEWQQAPAPLRSVVASPGVRDFNAPFAELWLDPATMVTAAAQPQWIAPILFTVWACGFAAIVLRRVRQWRDEGKPRFEGDAGRCGGCVELPPGQLRAIDQRSGGRCVPGRMAADRVSPGRYP